ncbi:MAG: HAD-IB family phosphatase [Thermoplasmata archaeon]
MARLVVFDMDGVLADIESSWVYVHRHFGVNNDHSLRAYLRGEIDDLEFIRRDIDLWRKKDPEVTENKIRKILDGVPIMPGAHETMKELRRIGAKTAIVSAGIDLLAERIALELSMDLQLANGLARDATGRLSGEGILRVRLMDKGDAITEASRKLGVPLDNTVAVGNSKYDVSMFRKAGLGIAFRPMDETIRRSTHAAVEEKNLSGILRFLRSPAQ